MHATLCSGGLGKVHEHTLNSWRTQLTSTLCGDPLLGVHTATAGVVCLDLGVLKASEVSSDQGRGMVSVEALEQLLERLLQDAETKDVEIEMQDGVLQAHACILCAASDAMRGMLRHGIAAEHKKLSWREHPLEVGRFFLRLLYTGTVAEEEWGERDNGEGLPPQTPLRLLTGGLAIAKVYQVPHLMVALTDALKKRLQDDTFDEIYSVAIKLDITALRLHCLRFAERSDVKEIVEGARVKALQHITVQNADVPVGSVGTVNSNHVIEWDDTGSIGYGTDVELVKDMVELIHSPSTSKVRSMYQAKELSPEVMFDLAALWGPPEPSVVRRRTL